jgi:hypothetical protein
MGTVKERSAVTTVRRGRPGAARPWHLSVTLAELITAIEDVVGLEDDAPVMATVWYLLRSWRLRGRVTGTRRGPPERREQGVSSMLTEGV